ncbi:MAG: carcinine hydrolase/isopenicillin-N N-acyltransferase family protein [Bacteroidia bacterium]|nr:carcinine hydrolase/isopenicillin-N N-acyltransferase family protein [Bacteroidia bacterium]
MGKIAILCILNLILIITNQAFACTLFLISGKNTADGKPILFKNRDADQMQNALAFFNDGKYKYIGLVNGTVNWSKEVWGGYNETGFAIINSAAYNNNVGDTTRLKDQEGVIMKLALQTCQTLADFENLIKTIPKPMGSDANFGVIDAFGGAAFYETGNFRFKKFDANDPTITKNGILVRTNHSMSADLTKGYGFNRYNTANNALNKAYGEKKIVPQFLFNLLSRNLYHSLTKTDLSADLPKQRNTPEFKFFIDYIPRESTASAVMMVGAKDQKHVKDAMMWTILGFPLTSVAIPAWISAGNQLPKAVTMDTSFKSPICSVALKFKAECFPITYDRGTNYINLSAVINQQKTGYMQLLQPIEKEIFERANLLIAELERGKKTEADIQSFYAWIDQYLSKSYSKQFKIDLFSN